MTGTSDIRELSATELDEVNGAVRIQIGAFHLTIGGPVAFGIGVRGVFEAAIFGDGGMCGHIGGNGGVGGCTP